MGAFLAPAAAAFLLGAGTQLGKSIAQPIGQTIGDGASEALGGVPRDKYGRPIRQISGQERMYVIASNPN